MDTIEEEEQGQRVSSKYCVSSDDDVDVACSNDDSDALFSASELETSKQSQVQCLTCGQNRLEQALLCL